MNSLAAGDQYRNDNHKNCHINVAARTINCTDSVTRVIENTYSSGDLKVAF